MKSFFISIIFTILIMTLTTRTSYAQTVCTKYEGNPVLDPGSAGSWDDWGVYAPFVLRDGDTLKMWYTGERISGTPQHIGYATSTDGITWHKYPKNPVLKVGAPGSWDSQYVGYPEVIKTDSTYHMWYIGTNNFNSNPAFRFGYATSSDGINWSKAEDVNPIMPLGDSGEWDDASYAGGSFFFDGDNFHLWYAGFDDVLTREGKIGYATSADGIHWTKDMLNNPFFDGSAGSWDSERVVVPCVIVDESGYKMWYQGNDGSSHWRIGYATSPDGINWAAENNPVLDIGDNGMCDDLSVNNPHVLFDNSVYKMWYIGFDNGTPNIGYHIGYAEAVPDAIGDLNLNLPNNYVLYQNYPNPFNPATVISWQLAVGSHVELSVYNLLGQKVATLVDKKQPAGSYQVQWDASAYASGIYIYRLKAKNQRQNAVFTKKLVLIK